MTESYLVEVLYTTGVLQRKIFSNTDSNNREQAWEYLNNIQRNAKPLTIVKSKIREVYSSNN